MCKLIYSISNEEQLSWNMFKSDFVKIIKWHFNCDNFSKDVHVAVARPRETPETNEKRHGLDV